MGTTKYDKLVRDRIPDIIRLRGGTPVCRTAGEREYWEKLLEKLREEVGEFLAASNDDDRKEELSDVLEVVRAISSFLKCEEHELEARRLKKAEERGGFERRIILEEA